MSSTQVSLTVEGAHASITFSTEEGVNILSSTVIENFRKVIAQLREKTEVRTMVVRATGKVFLAGADIKEMSSFSYDQALQYGKLGQTAFNELESLPCITVAAINGAAMGGGFELALACDFRIAVKSAKLGLPETSLGLIPGWGGIPRLIKLIGPSRAKKLILAALPISAEDGLPFGLVDEVFNSAEDVESRTLPFCNAFKRGSPTAVAIAKKVALEGDDLEAFAKCFETEDKKEGVAAFVDKRPASWME